MATDTEVRPGARALRAVLFAVGMSSSVIFATEVASLAPRAINWAEEQAEAVAHVGHALTPRQLALARAVGVRHPERIRIEVVGQFPIPQDADMKAAATQIGLARPSIVGLTLGYSVMLRRGHENEPRLLRHEFRHVSQYEARGGIAEFLMQHLQDLARYGYEDSPYEVDARAHEVEHNRHL